MSRGRKQLLVVFALVAAIVVTLILAGPSIQRSVFYPKPRGLPPVVGQTTEHLLTRLQSVLETNAPIAKWFDLVKTISSQRTTGWPSR